MHVRAFAVCAILGTAVLFAYAPAAAQPAAWLAASDLHLDPFERSAQPSPMAADSNVALFESMLREMKRAVPDPAVVLLPGDFLVHHFARSVRNSGGGNSVDEAGIQTMRRIAGDFDRTFPRAQFAIATGNNDAPCGDYKSDLDGPFLRAVARIWEPLVNRRGAAPNFQTSFADGGYYAATLAPARLRLVVLNTVPFSKLYRGTCIGGSPAAATKELAWLRATLSATPSGVRNVVMMHVPPGYDAFSTRLLHGFLAWPFMGGGDGRALIGALAAPENHVAYAIAGHTHRFDFRLAGPVPIVVLGAVSPVYHNNPAFYALHVGADGSLLDIDTYAFEQSAQRWAGPRSFDREWRVRRLDAAALRRIHQRLSRDPGMRRAWDFASTGWPVRLPRSWRMWSDAGAWEMPWCAQTELGAGFARCAGIVGRNALGLTILGAIGVLGFVTLVVLPVAAVVRWSRTKRRVAP